MSNRLVYIVNKGEIDLCGYITHYSLLIYDDLDFTIKVDEDNYVRGDHPLDKYLNIDPNKKYLLCEYNRYGFLHNNEKTIFDVNKSDSILQQLKELVFERNIVFN